jgi:hypothetical protein
VDRNVQSLTIKRLIEALHTPDPNQASFFWRWIIVWSSLHSLVQTRGWHPKPSADPQTEKNWYLSFLQLGLHFALLEQFQDIRVIICPSNSANKINTPQQTGISMAQAIVPLYKYTVMWREICLPEDVFVNPKASSYINYIMGANGIVKCSHSITLLSDVIHYFCDRRESPAESRS